MIGKFLSWVMAKFPAKGNEILAKLNARLKTTFTSVGELPSAVAQLAKDKPATTGVVLSTLGSVLGYEVVAALLGEFESQGNSVTELTKAQSAIMDLVKQNSGDQSSTTVWGVDAADIKKNAMDLSEAFKLIQSAGSIVGGHNVLKQLFIAMHALEIEHFALYEEQYKLFNGR